MAGEEVGGVWQSGCLVYGVPIGTDPYVSYMLDKKVEEIANKAIKTSKVLEGESQALWAVLRQSLQQKFGYWLSLVHPSQVAAAASKVDEVLRRVLEQVAGFSIPLRGEDLSYTCRWMYWGEHPSRRSSLASPSSRAASG